MQNQKRLSGNTPILMVFIAFAVDLSQIALDAVAIGLAVNRLIDIVVLLFFKRWFNAHKINFVGIRALIFYGLAFVEFIPVADAFPLWIIDIIAVIITVNMEDRLGQRAEEIINNPRTQRILKKGIMKTIKIVESRNEILKSQVAAARRNKNEEIDSRNEKPVQRNIDNSPNPNINRDNVLSE